MVEHLWPAVAGLGGFITVFITVFITTLDNSAINTALPKTDHKRLPILPKAPIKQFQTANMAAAVRIWIFPLTTSQPRRCYKKCIRQILAQQLPK
jgi:hypothetical protein